MSDPVSEQLQIFKSKVEEVGVIKTSNGRPVDSLTASLSGGPHGPIPLKDFNYLDHIAAFDRERIPERVVHAKGTGAFGHFEVTSEEFKKYCKATVFESVGKKTPVAVRFSQVNGESGSADTVRDPRGFALKFYTDEGNWDLVANNTPLFFIRDPILFPSFIHSQKRHPATHCRDPNAYWDFLSLRPESTHQVTYLFSDRGIPDGYRHMNGYSGHSFKTVNDQGEAFYVKWHFKTNQGIKNLDVAEAARLAGVDPDYAARDLFNAIAVGNFPSWTAFYQVVPAAEALKMKNDLFDVTKVLPHGQFPLHELGRLVFDRNPVNYFAEVEQIAFDPAHLIPGIEPSHDKMLQGRLFSYGDTQRHRLGVNYQLIPVNCPYATKPVQNYQRDGFMRVDGNQGDAPHYFPNSFGGPQPADPKRVGGVPEPASLDPDDLVGRYESGGDEYDNFSQPGVLFRDVLSAEERERLTDNIAQHLFAAAEFIQDRAVANFSAADPQYGEMVSAKLHKLREMKAEVMQYKQEKLEQDGGNPDEPTSALPGHVASANF